MSAMPVAGGGASLLAGPSGLFASLGSAALGTIGRVATQPNVSSAQSGGMGNGLDGSGWAVNFRGMQSASSTPSRSYSSPQPLVQQQPDWQGLPFIAGPGSSVPQMAGASWMWWAVGGLALVAIWRSKK